MKRTICFYCLVLVSSVNVFTACQVNDYFAFHLAGEEVRHVELIQLEPETGNLKKREVLAEARINEFVSALRRANYRGAYNEAMPYVIKLKLGSGETAELKATEQMVSDWRKEYYYAVDLKRFFSRFFEELSSNAPPNKALQLTAR